jgi:hypothetical protein
MVAAIGAIRGFLITLMPQNLSESVKSLLHAIPIGFSLVRCEFLNDLLIRLARISNPKWYQVLL